MKKSLFTLLVLIMLSACGGQTPLTPPADLVATSVQETLAAVPTITPVQVTTTATSAILDAPTETATLEPTATQTITPSPTIVLEDIRNTFGSPAWQDTLDNCTSFGLCSAYEDDFSKVSVASGSLILTSKSASGFRTWRLTYPRPQNMYLEATFKTQTCSAGDNYGLVFRAKDYTSGEGYYLGFTCDGQSGLIRWNASGTATVLSFTQSNSINAGANQTNRMGVIANGSSFRIYANGKFLQEISDTSISGEGHVGAYIAGSSSPGFTVEMSEIAYWNLP